MVEGDVILNKYKDKAGLFSDFNFKLVVINSLIESEEFTRFEDDLQKLEERFVDNYEWYEDNPPIPELMQYFSELVLEESDLNSITELVFDGGNEIYASYLKPDWDGDDDIFDVKSIEGYQKLVNLKTVYAIGMVDEDVLAPMINDE
ncbi:DUF6892 domain-containing protein [Cytobacillus sp. Hm23]